MTPKIGPQKHKQIINYCHQLNSLVFSLNTKNFFPFFFFSFVILLLSSAHSFIYISDLMHPAHKKNDVSFEYTKFISSIKYFIVLYRIL